MGRVLTHLEALDRELQSREPHPVLGTASLHASLINGGRELSTCPDRCVLHMERRSITGEGCDTALAEVEAILASLRSEDDQFRATAKVLFDRRPYETPQNHFLIPALEAALAKAGLVPSRGGVSFWTDAAILGHGGIPSVIFGPGGAGLHGAEEYVEVDKVLASRDTLVELALRMSRK
jgi:acetylornithine deacetylase